MALSADAIDELRVEIAIDLARFSREIQQVKDTVQRANAANDTAFQKLKSGVDSTLGSFRQLRTVVSGVAVAIGVQQALSFGRSALEAADALDETAGRLGFTIERFQEIQFAATLTGQSVQEFTSGLQRFAANVGQAALGQGDFRNTLDQLGISLEAQGGRLKTNGELFDEYIEKLGGISDAAVQATRAQEAFGRGGNKFINLAGQLSQLSARARELGLVLSTTTVRQLAELNDKLDITTKAIQVNLSQALVSAGPALAFFAEQVQLSARGFGLIFDAIRRGLAGSSLTELNKELGELAEKIAQLEGRQLGVQDRGVLNRLRRRREEILEEKRKIEAELRAGLPGPARQDGGVLVGLDEGAVEKARTVLSGINAEFVKATQDRIAQIELERDAQLEALKGIQASAEEVAKARLQIEETTSAKIRAELEEIVKANAEAAKKRADDEIAEKQRVADRVNEIVNDLNQAQDAKDKARLEQQRAAIESFSRQVSDILLSDGDRTFKELGQLFLRNFLQFALQKLIESALFDIVTALQGSGRTTAANALVQGIGVFAGAFAGGGTIPPGQFGLVGENGPELVSGGNTGRRITPIGGRGGGVILNVYTDQPQQNVQVVEAGFSGGRQVLEIAVGNIVKRQFGQGAFDAQLTSRFQGLRPRTTR